MQAFCGVKPSMVYSTMEDDWKFPIQIVPSGGQFFVVDISFCTPEKQLQVTLAIQNDYWLHDRNLIGGWIPKNFQVPGVGVPENILMRHYIHSLRNLLFIGKNLGFCYLERLLIADGFLVNVHSKICLPFSPGELNHEISFKTLRQMFGSSPVMGSTKSIKVG